MDEDPSRSTLITLLLELGQEIILFSPSSIFNWCDKDCSELRTLLRAVITFLRKRSEVGDF
jgi:hypothetical protein